MVLAVKLDYLGIAHLGQINAIALSVEKRTPLVQFGSISVSLFLLSFNKTMPVCPAPDRAMCLAIDGAAEMESGKISKKSEKLQQTLDWESAGRLLG